MATIVALYAGAIRASILAGRQAATAIAKVPVSGPVRVAELGLAGDQQADAGSHGGPDQAVCVYPDEHYRYWKERLGRPLAPPAFGENARVSGRLERDVALGEVWQVDGVRLQVTQPRVPCWKPAARNGEPRLTAWMGRTGFTGYLLRVLDNGEMAPGAAIEVIDRPPRPLTIDELNRLYFRDRDDVEGLRRALAADALLARWRERLEKLLLNALR